MSEKFPVTVSWKGTTSDATYTRSSLLAKPGAPAPIPASSSVANGGEASRWNPEDLLAAAMAQCHMLTFLALATKVRLEVVAYEGAAEAAMETVDRITKVAAIALRPTITVAPGTSHDKVREMFEKAHKYCVIANSFNGEVTLEPSVVDA
ncbi:OsmC family protein [Mesoterricola silvestris]|uniref:Peroxiredoxin n=1 Tax=Mesoterricola silvestris TaxID=2927979 RepID=A0AA48GSG8_9BACT|nr:OsmC family protein [Mesoterricola silvestris]BDU70921.1 peroxiredoxin [Mesoterricola silvestris]